MAAEPGTEPALRGFQEGCPAVPDPVTAWVLVGVAAGLLARTSCLEGLGGSGAGAGVRKRRKVERALVCGLRTGDGAGESPGHGQRGAARVSPRGFPASSHGGRTLRCRRVSGGAEAPGTWCRSRGSKSDQRLLRAGIEPAT